MEACKSYSFVSAMPWSLFFGFVTSPRWEAARFPGGSSAAWFMDTFVDLGSPHYISHGHRGGLFLFLNSEIFHFEMPKHAECCCSQPEKYLFSLFLGAFFLRVSISDKKQYFALRRVIFHIRKHRKTEHSTENQAFSENKQPPLSYSFADFQSDCTQNS